jgi:hypothetical protein
MNEEKELEIELTWGLCEEIIASENKDWKLKKKLFEFLLSKCELEEEKALLKNFIIENCDFLINEIYDLRSGYVNLVSSLLIKIFEGCIGVEKELNQISKIFLSSEELIKGLASGNSVIQNLTHECLKTYFEKCNFMEIEEIKNFHERNKIHKNYLVRENVIMGVYLLMLRVCQNNFNIKVVDIEFFTNSKEFFIKDKNENVRLLAIKMDENLENFLQNVYSRNQDFNINYLAKKQSLFDVINCQKMNIKSKKQFFTKFDFAKFYQTCKFNDFLDVVENLQTTKNYEIKNFLSKLLNDFPISENLDNILIYLERNDLSKNFIFTKFLQKVYKGSLKVFFLFHYKTNTINSLNILLKRFQITSFKKISSKILPLCENILIMSLDNIETKENEDFVKMNFLLIEKMSEDDNIKKLINDKFSEEKYKITISKNSSLFNKVFGDDEEKLELKLVSKKDKISNGCTNIEEDLPNKKKILSEIFSEKNIEEMLFETKEEEEKEELRENGFSTKNISETTIEL